jgi:hypothetical protein
MLNMRNHRPAMTPATPHQRGVAISADGGVTFGPAGRHLALPEPICQASILRIDPRTLAFANPASERAREKMTVRFSRDDGDTWPTSLEIFPGPAPTPASSPCRTRGSVCSTSAARKNPTSGSSWHGSSRASDPPKG